MSLNGNKEDRERRKCQFERELENKYYIETHNGITCRHVNK